MKNRIINDKGIALFLVLWVLVLLMVIVGEFSYAIKTEINITRNFKESTEARYIAEAGISSAIIGLIEEKLTPPKPPSEEPQPEENDEEAVRWRVNARIPEIPFGSGAFKIRIENEAGKVNINRADKRLLKIILGDFDCDDDEKDVIVDSIIDWRDKDSFHQLNGAEDDYYESLSEPYECKDADFDSVEELLLVKGVTEEIFYGGLRDMVTIIPGNDPVKKKTITRKKRRRSKRGFNYNRININAASARILLSLPEMTEDLVQEITEFRKEDDFYSLTDLSELLGPEVYSMVAPYLTLQTNSYFTIESVGTLGGSLVKQGVKALVKIDLKVKKRYSILQWLKG